MESSASDEDASGGSEAGVDVLLGVDVAAGVADKSPAVMSVDVGVEDEDGVEDAISSSEELAISGVEVEDSVDDGVKDASVTILSSGEELAIDGVEDGAEDGVEEASGARETSVLLGVVLLGVDVEICGILSAAKTFSGDAPSRDKKTTAKKNTVSRRALGDIVYK